MVNLRPTVITAVVLSSAEALSANYQINAAASSAKAGLTSTKEPGSRAPNAGPAQPARHAITKKLACLAGGDDDGESDVDIDDPFGEFNIDEDLDEEVPSSVQKGRAKAVGAVSGISMDISDAPQAQDPECSSMGMECPISTVQPPPAPANIDSQAHVQMATVHDAVVHTACPGTEAADEEMQDVATGAFDTQQETGAVHADERPGSTLIAAENMTQIQDHELQTQVDGTIETQELETVSAEVFETHGHAPAPSNIATGEDGNAEQHTMAPADEHMEPSDAGQVDQHATQEGEDRSDTLAPTTSMTDALVPTFWDNAPAHQAASAPAATPSQSTFDAAGPTFHTGTGVTAPAVASLASKHLAAVMTAQGDPSEGTQPPSAPTIDHTPGNAITRESHAPLLHDEQAAPVLLSAAKHSDSTAMPPAAQAPQLTSSLQPIPSGGSVPNTVPTQATEYMPVSHDFLADVEAPSCLPAARNAAPDNISAPAHVCTDANPSIPVEQAAYLGTAPMQLDGDPEHQVASARPAQVVAEAPVAPAAPQVATVEMESVPGPTVAVGQNRDSVMDCDSWTGAQHDTTQVTSSAAAHIPSNTPASSERTPTATLPRPFPAAAGGPSSVTQPGTTFQQHHSPAETPAAARKQQVHNRASFGEWLSVAPSTSHVSASQHPSAPSGNTDSRAAVNPIPQQQPNATLKNPTQAPFTCNTTAATKHSFPAAASVASASLPALSHRPPQPSPALPIQKVQHSAPVTKQHSLFSHPSHATASGQTQSPADRSMLHKSELAPDRLQNQSFGDGVTPPAKRKSGQSGEPKGPKQLRGADTAKSSTTLVPAAAVHTIREQQNPAPAFDGAEKLSARPSKSVAILQDSTNRTPMPKNHSAQGNVPRKPNDLTASPFKGSAQPNRVPQSHTAGAVPDSVVQEHVTSGTEGLQGGNCKAGGVTEQGADGSVPQDCNSMSSAQAIASLSKYRKEIAELTVSMQEIGIRVEAAADEALELRVDAAVLKNRWARLAQPETVGTVREELETATRFLQEAEAAADAATATAERMGWLSKQPDGMECDS